MFIQQLYTPCLSEAAYYVESNGEAAIIDPIRDITPYLSLAQSRNATIRYIFETHFHADFVSGHLDLARKTNAPIVFGPETKTHFPVTVAKDGESFQLGEISIIAVHTPGHTVESTCWLLKTEKGQPHALFTGDTLFVGDVGRPDLSSGDQTPEVLAGMLYDSLQEKVIPLPDEVLVYPAHGAGSACGKHIGKEKFSTLGEQKLQNPALQHSSKEEFIASVTKGIPPAPPYFATNARINQQGYEAFEEVLGKSLCAIDPKTFAKHLNSDRYQLVDTRPVAEFTLGFIPGSVSLGLEGRMAEWAGSLLSFEKPILLVTNTGAEAESITRLARVGFDNVAGYLEGGFEAWQSGSMPIDMIIDIEADELAMDLPFDDQLLVVDVRNTAEFGSGHIVGAYSLPLADMTDLAKLAMVPAEGNVYLHCGSGYRSVIAASLLKRQGYHNLRNVIGGWEAISREPKIPTEKDERVLN